MDMPAHIGRFRIDGRLGCGGMGEVYKAFDPKLHRTIALKTVRSDVRSPTYLERLCREAEAAGRLEHPNIVRVYDTGEVDGIVFIAMECLAGSSLADLLERGELTFEQQLAVLSEILTALEYAHAQGVIHRDIKPGNVQRLPDGSIKLLDFGLARVEDGASLTQTGSVMGTPHYASPEQLNGDTVDVRTDIYSAGALAYEMFTGRKPFESDSLVSVIRKVLTDSPPPMNTMWTRRFPELEPIVMRAMAKSPAERYASVAEMRSAVDAFAARSRDSIARLQSDIASGDTMADTAASTPEAIPHPSPWAVKGGWWVAASVAAVAVASIATFTRQSALPAEAPAAIASDAAPVSTGATTPDAGRPDTPTPPPPTMQSGQTAAPAGEPTASAAIEPDAAGDREPVSARQLFLAADSGTANAGLRYSLIQKLSSGGEVEVDPQTNFRTGDRVRMAFESNLDGFLYVIQEGSSGRWTVLFPHPEMNGGRNAIVRQRRYLVPENGWFVFDANPGVERLFVFLSREAASQLPGFDRPLSGPQTVTSAVVEELRHSIRPRDLVFEKDNPAPGQQAGQATYVVNRDELGKYVATTIQFAHGR
jgi:tRNA A-37 threonylcarbamoyl transferase component Bud32